MSKKFWLRSHSDPCYDVTIATIIWTIDNFIDLKEENGHSILSPSFRVEHLQDTLAFEETKWQIQLYPGWDPSSPDDGHASVLIHGAIGIGKVKKGNVDISVSIIDNCLNRISEKRLKHVANYKKLFHDEDACYGESTYSPRYDFNRDKDVEKILPGGSLTLEVKLCINTEFTIDDDEINPSKDVEIENESIDLQTSGSKELSEHLGKLLESKESSDMEIDCGGKVFSCHKLFVSARSPVFKAMFETKMKESDSGKVTIEDIKPEVMTEMLHFMYTGSLAKETVTTEFAIELLAAADKYQLEALKDICQGKIRSVLDEENAIEFLILGEMYQATKLKDAALMEVAHNMPGIAGTEDYQKLVNYPKLALEIPLAMLK